MMLGISPHSSKDRARASGARNRGSIPLEDTNTGRLWPSFVLA
jgi:hypothetical protein